MENYIVRIYRRDNTNPDLITGIVEKPDSGENITFKSNEEFIGIFISPESNIRRKNNQQVVEQRKYRRFKVRDSTLIFDTTTDVGEIIDISLGGLSFYCPNMSEKSKGLFRVDILCEGAKDFCTGKINCKKLMFYDSEQKSHDPQKRLSLEFESLNSRQKMLLEYIIQNYSVGEA